jgi:hypothetical protein
MVLRPTIFWDCEFKSPQGHGCLSLLSVVCSHVVVSASGWSLVQRNPIECSVSEYDREASIMRRPWPTRDWWATERKWCSFIFGNVDILPHGKYISSTPTIKIIWKRFMRNPNYFRRIWEPDVVCGQWHNTALQSKAVASARNFRDRGLVKHLHST